MKNTYIDPHLPLSERLEALDAPALLVQGAKVPDDQGIKHNSKLNIDKT